MVTELSLSVNVVEDAEALDRAHPSGTLTLNGAPCGENGT